MECIAVQNNSNWPYPIVAASKIIFFKCSSGHLGQKDEGLTLINKALEIEPNNTKVLELRKHLLEYMK